MGGRGIKRSLENAASQSLLLGRRDEGVVAEKVITVIRSVSEFRQLMSEHWDLRCCFLAFSPPKINHMDPDKK